MRQGSRSLQSARQAGTPVVAGCVILTGVQVLCGTLQLLTQVPGVLDVPPHLLSLIQQLRHTWHMSIGWLSMDICGVNVVNSTGYNREAGRRNVADHALACKVWLDSSALLRSGF